MQFQLKITNMNNAAFEGDAAAEVRRILHKYADRVDVMEGDGIILDVNGNTVGSWEFTEDES